MNNEVMLLVQSDLPFVTLVRALASEGLRLSNHNGKLYIVRAEDEMPQEQYVRLIDKVVVGGD